MRTVLLLASAGLALLVAGCSTTDTPDGHTRVETWTTRTTFGDDGPKTTEEHSVTYRKDAEKGPEWSVGGVFQIEDIVGQSTGDRDCFVELTPAKLGDVNFVAKYINDTCTADMKHVAGWRPIGTAAGDTIVLVNGSGYTIGTLDRTEAGSALYRGVFTLTNGTEITAQMRRW